MKLKRVLPLEITSEEMITNNMKKETFFNVKYLQPGIFAGQEIYP